MKIRTKWKIYKILMVPWRLFDFIKIYYSKGLIKLIIKIP